MELWPWSLGPLALGKSRCQVRGLFTLRLLCCRNPKMLWHSKRGAQSTPDFPVIPGPDPMPGTWAEEVFRGLQASAPTCLNWWRPQEGDDQMNFQVPDPWVTLIYCFNSVVWGWFVTQLQVPRTLLYNSLSEGNVHLRINNVTLSLVHESTNFVHPLRPVLLVNDLYWNS